MNKNIGELIKQKRTENKMTLKDISEAAMSGKFCVLREAQSSNMR